uniref:Uncharacterized protein n=1 Tax=Acrobeloides nanus TaxID=290746 RepID=A0A914CC15_9BILA
MMKTGSFVLLAAIFEFSCAQIQIPQVYVGTYTASIQVQGNSSANGTVIAEVQVLQSFISFTGAIFLEGNTGRRQIGGFVAVGTIQTINNVHHINIDGQIVVVIDAKLLSGRIQLSGDWQNQGTLDLIIIQAGLTANLNLTGTATLVNVLTGVNEDDQITTEGTLIPGILTVG